MKTTRAKHPKAAPSPLEQWKATQITSGVLEEGHRMEGSDPPLDSVIKLKLLRNFRTTGTKDPPKAPPGQAGVGKRGTVQWYGKDMTPEEAVLGSGGQTCFVTRTTTVASPKQSGMFIFCPYSCVNPHFPVETPWSCQAMFSGLT